MLSCRVQIAQLRRQDPNRRMDRFYAISVLPTLFGDFAVVCRWGRSGCEGARQEHWRAEWAAALEFAEVQAARKRRRGYADVHEQRVRLEPAGVRRPA